MHVLAAARAQAYPQDRVDVRAGRAVEENGGRLGRRQIKIDLY
jgi:hypothetical protein